MRQRGSKRAVAFFKSLKLSCALPLSSGQHKKEMTLLKPISSVCVLVAVTGTKLSWRELTISAGKDDSSPL